MSGIDRKIFAKRFKMLRLAHGLSNASIADLLSLRSTGSITTLESQRGIPSAGVLIDIANLFGVSVDWLAGREKVREVYRIDILLGLEEMHIRRIDSSRYYEIYDYTRYINISSDYLKKREECFSLPVRANIIYILNCLTFESDRYIHGEEIKPKRGHKKKIEQFVKNINELMQGQGRRDSPIYDIYLEKETSGS